MLRLMVRALILGLIPVHSLLAQDTAATSVRTRTSRASGPTSPSIRLPGTDRLLAASGWVGY